MKKVSSVIGLLREFDVKVKGVDANSILHISSLKKLLVMVIDYKSA